MARPCCCRKGAGMPPCVLFKPCGIPASSWEEVALQLDELEAICLTDFKGLYQAQAAARMGISRQTVGRIVESARRKVAEALSQGKALRIEGGSIKMAETRKFKCYDCQHVWEPPYGSGRAQECPKCESRSIHREGVGRIGGVGRGRCFRGGR